MSSTLNSDNLNGNITSSENLSGTLNSSGTLSGEISLASGGSGTDNYNDLSNKPQINGVTLSGNKTTSDLNLFSGYIEDLHYTDLIESGTIPYMVYGSQSQHWGMNTGAQLHRLSDVAFYSPASLSNGDVLAIDGAGTTNYKWTKTHLGAAAYTNDYNDLDNQPTIPAAQVNSDWNSVSGVSQILNKPTLANVATSGSYNDLTDQPTIPDKLSDLTDTNINSPTDGQYLKYDSSSSKWVNASGGSGGASALTDLTDTSITTPSGGQVLKYDGTAQKWVNVYLSYNNLVDKPTIPKADDYTSTPEIVGTWSDGTNTYDVYRKTVFLSSPVTCSAGNTSAAGSWTSVQSGWNNTTIVLDFEAFSYSGNDKTYLGHLSAQWSNTNKDIRVLNIRSVQASIDSFRITYVEP